MSENPAWPELPLSAWSDTCETLHRWTQVVGKVRMARTPLLNHWWNVTLYVTPRGLTTSPIADGTRTFSIDFDFLAHELSIVTSDGATERFALKPMSVADFYAEVMARLERLGLEVHIWTMPNEIEDAVPFDQDRAHAQYDPVWVGRFWQALRQSDRVLKEFRARFIGKASPVHFFWGSFDLAVTRFSGRTAPPHPAASRPTSRSGSWPRPTRTRSRAAASGRATAATAGRPIYVYAYPEPAGYGETKLGTPDAVYDKGLGQFILPYDAVRRSPDPDALLLGFLQETYAAAATLAKWDRKALERA